MALRIGKTALLLAALLLLLAARPSSSLSAENTIGIIMTGDVPYYDDLHGALMAKLRKEGIAGKTAVIMQKPYPDSISLSNAARKLIALDVDVIVVYGAPAALAVVKEKTKIPMVYAAVYEPIISRVKSRYNTGVSVKLSISSLLRYLKGLKPLTTLGVVYSSSEEDSVYQFMELSKLAEPQGIKIEGINLKRHQEAKEKLALKKMDGLLLTGSSVAHMAMNQVIEYAKEQRIPYASFLLCRDSRIIVALTTNPAEQGEKAAEKVIKVLDGVPPEKIKPESSNEVELIFNLKESTAMGWKLPMDLVTEATRLIK
jgi:putative ABC transport system substrate-binding protein